MRPPENWRTERLRLRPAVEADAEGAYSNWVHDIEVTRFLEIRFATPDPAALASYIAKMNASPSDVFAAIERASDGSHIGNMRLGPIEPDHRRAAIGIMIGDRSAWGQGYASEAIDAVAKHAFVALGIEKLTAGLYAPNLGSRRAFEKAGFHVEAVRAAHAICEGVRVDVIEMARFR